MCWFHATLSLARRRSNPIIFETLAHIQQCRKTPLDCGFLDPATPGHKLLFSPRYHHPAPHMPGRGLKSLGTFLAGIGGSLELDTFNPPPIQHQNDVYIMDMVLQGGLFSDSAIHQINHNSAWHLSCRWDISQLWYVEQYTRTSKQFLVLNPN
jgi:hypothetical protein